MSYSYEWSLPAVEKNPMEDTRTINVNEVVDLKLLSKRFAKVFDANAILARLEASLRRESCHKQHQIDHVRMHPWGIRRGNESMKGLWRIRDPDDNLILIQRRKDRMSDINELLDILAALESKANSRFKTKQNGKGSVMTPFLVAV
ncbi:MAG: hypothetical protein SGARI_006335, partial [Bacillariaceae sp.]